MQARRSDLADLAYFLEIAKHRNFRRAGHDLGISASALSHAIRGLEERLGVRLLNRTSRSVTLTAAGEDLRTTILEPFGQITQALDVLNRYRDAPSGRIRLSVPTEAAEFVVGPVLPAFLERYPDVEIEISVSNHMIDVIDGGFDAGIRYGGTVPEDMIAQRLAQTSGGSSLPRRPIWSASGSRATQAICRTIAGCGSVSATIVSIGGNSSAETKTSRLTFPVRSQSIREP
jgi:DNA-binding transcriptional LysR family regulator